MLPFRILYSGDAVTHWHGAGEGIKGTEENSRRARYLIKQRPHCTRFKITFTEAWILAYWSEEESISAHKECDVVDCTTDIGASCTVAFGRKNYVGKVAATGMKLILFYARVISKYILLYI